jgi:GT2 family glycosyltransferase
VEPDAVPTLVKALRDDRVGIVTAGVRLLDSPGLMNTAGNPVHFTGLSWAGGLGRPATDYPERRCVAAASGCAMAVRRGVWEQLDGLCEEMFAYCEDTDLSLRCWLAGWTVESVPEAVVAHRYEFSRNRAKRYWLERNRLVMLLTVLETRTLLVLAPALLALEVAVTAVALREGWARQKAAGWWWLVRHRSWLVRRRAAVQRTRRAPDGVLVPLLAADLDPGPSVDVPRSAVLSLASRVYWRMASRLIRGSRLSAPRR